MSYLNLSLDYFSHPKTMRLAGLLGRNAEVLPIRLWCYCGKHHCVDGKLSGYGPHEVEAVVGWWGKSGGMVEAMIKVGYLEEKDDGFIVTDWLDHNGHLAAFKSRAKKAAKERWGIGSSEQLSNAKDDSKQCPNRTVPNRTVPVKSYVEFENSTLTAWNVFCDEHPRLKKIRSLSGTRRKHLKKRFEEKEFQDFTKILQAVANQPFLLNGNASSEKFKNWKVSFDWLIGNDTNYLKVLEMHYLDEKGVSEHDFIRR